MKEIFYDSCLVYGACMASSQPVCMHSNTAHCTQVTLPCSYQYSISNTPSHHSNQPSWVVQQKPNHPVAQFLLLDHITEADKIDFILWSYKTHSSFRSTDFTYPSPFTLIFNRPRMRKSYAYRLTKRYQVFLSILLTTVLTNGVIY